MGGIVTRVAKEKRAEWEDAKLLRRNTEANVSALAALAVLPPQNQEKTSPLRVQVIEVPSERFYLEDEPAAWMYRDVEACTCGTPKSCTCQHEGPTSCTRIEPRALPEVAIASSQHSPILRKAVSPSPLPYPVTANLRLRSTDQPQAAPETLVPTPRTQFQLRRRQTGLSPSPSPRVHTQHAATDGGRSGGRQGEWRSALGDDNQLPEHGDERQSSGEQRVSADGEREHLTEREQEQSEQTSLEQAAGAKHGEKGSGKEIEMLAPPASA
jgi:hypothetical protein